MAVKSDIDNVNLDDLDMEGFKALVKGKKVEDFVGDHPKDAVVEESEPEVEESDDESADDVDEDVETVDDESSDVDESDDEDEAPAKPKHVPTKAEKAIIESKRANKLLKDQLADAQRKLDALSVQEQAKAKMQKYIDRGFDEEDAKEQSEREARLESYESKFAILEFKMDNPDVVRKYPDMDIAKVKAVIATSGADAESVCKMLYGSKSSITDKAKAVAIEQAKKSKSSATGVVATSNSPKSSGEQPKLTAEEERVRAHIERVTGRQISAKEYKEQIE